jgi:hypothetical protein
MLLHNPPDDGNANPTSLVIRVELLTHHQRTAGDSLADLHAAAIENIMLQGYGTCEEETPGVENAYIGILGMVLEDTRKDGFKCPAALIERLDQIGHILNFPDEGPFE